MPMTPAQIRYYSSENYIRRHRRHARAYQLRRIQAGLCGVCGDEPLVNKNMGEHCRSKHRELDRASYALKKNSGKG